MAWDPERPLPPDEGQAHTHTAAQFAVHAMCAGPGNDVAPEGEWRVVITMSTLVELPANHRLSHALTYAQAMKLVDAITQAAGDMAAGRFDR